MFDRTVIGVDPGVAALGLACVTGGSGGRPEVSWARTVRTPPDLGGAGRLRRIHAEVSAAIASVRPETVAVERLMWGRNITSAMDVARASGVILLAAAEAGVPVAEYAPLEVKLAVAGAGNAPKSQVRRALEMLLAPGQVPVGPDAADAVAVAVCHLRQSRLRLVGRGAAR